MKSEVNDLLRKVEHKDPIRDMYRNYQRTKRKARYDIQCNDGRILEMKRKERTL